MKKDYKKITLLSCVLLITMTISCKKQQKTPDVIAADFLNALCNYDFDKAATFFTEGSKKMISFFASNTTPEILNFKNDNSILSQTTQVNIVSINDSTASVTCDITNVISQNLSNDSIITSDKTISLTLIKKENIWKVKMEVPQQNER